MINYLKKEKVLSIALILAVLSMFFVHPDAGYADYIDLRVLALLFCLMLLVKGFQSVGLLDWLIERLFGGIANSRRMGQILIGICFFSSMLMTNDVALITFVPFAVLTLKRCAMEKMMIRVVVLQTLAANLGSMFTPIGNPQNLYLFSVSGISTGRFFQTMLPVTVVSFVLLWLATFLLPKEEIRLDRIELEAGTALSKPLLAVYTILFVMNLLVVFRVVSWLPVLILTIAVMLALRKFALFRKVDYALLLTFVGFFVFVGNIGRVPAISQAIGQILTGREILVSALFSQFLSNVPAAILLSGFTDQFEALMLGTNIGGLGTLIASMASLISYKEYAASSDSKKGKYLLTFTIYNVIGLVILLLFAAFYY